MRILLLSVGVLLLQACHVQAKAVFAHFMVGNTPTWALSDWKSNIQLAVDAHIDTFALNIANGWYANDASLALAFEAAASLDFQLFFSFDYAGNGSWAQADVISLITQYGGSGAYFQYNGGPFVSTFDGPDHADDWVEIKSQTGCFFIPDWSSLGAIPAAAAANGVVDGLFSWAGWPWGDKSMTTFVDASYMQTLNASGKPYMMPVSPWFYTNLPGYDKNWLWRGDDSWYQRWQQVWYLQPEFVEIISWNDFGESHYIGPLDNSSFDAFTVGEAPFNYAKDMPHDGWRDLLPFMIDTYKHERALVSNERLVVWYRNSLAGDCSNGNTTGNTASQLQLEFAPEDVSQDRIYFTALLSDYADVSVKVDAYVHKAEWDFLPPGPLVTGGPGLYHGSIALTHAERIEVIITRDDVDIFSVFTVQDVSADNCVDGLTNWNAWVASGSGGDLPEPVYSAFNLSVQTCVSGYSVDTFTDLCEFTCAWGYCPVGACVCTNMGIILKEANQTDVVGYPANGDANYAGLCSFACAAGYCPSDYCSLEVQAAYVPTSSPFDPPTCTGGSSTNSNFLGLCSYACNYGFCPRSSCSCTSTGPLIQPPAQTSSSGTSLVGPDSDLCNFACTRGYCPSGTCAQSVVGYVHFGDSYAAGMGTGITSTDECRVGSNNYGKLLYQWFDDESLSFETLACSGDTTTGLSEQIDKWKTSDVANVGTLTMGGNDLGFSNLVYYCVITFNMWYFKEQNRQYCLEYEATARSLLEDSSDAGLTAKLTNAYLKILTKSARTDFNLYVTGYPGFFNYDTADCDLSTFHYWYPGYNQGWADTGYYAYQRLVLLTQDLRTELDALVDQLNGVIQQAINDANAQYGGSHIHYVNIQPYFDTHRWCENADASYHEPDPNLDSTWFFLSAWDDVDLETDTITTSEAEAAEMATLMSQGPIVLPDAENCTESLGTDPDPYAVAMCRVAIAVADNSTGLEATTLAQANADIASGNYASQAVPSYLPTRQIKTFHPRSPGTMAYRNAIINAM